MAESNGPARGHVATYAMITLAAFSGAVSVLVFVINLWITPVKDLAVKNESEIRRIAELAAQRGIEIPNIRTDIRRLEEEIKRIAELAAQRGVELPNMRADIARIEADLHRLTDGVTQRAVEDRNSLKRIDEEITKLKNMTATTDRKR